MDPQSKPSEMVKTLVKMTLQFSFYGLLFISRVVLYYSVGLFKSPNKIKKYFLNELMILKERTRGHFFGTSHITLCGCSASQLCMKSSLCNVNWDGVIIVYCAMYIFCIRDTTNKSRPFLMM